MDSTVCETIGKFSIISLEALNVNFERVGNNHGFFSEFAKKIFNETGITIFFLFT